MTKRHEAALPQVTLEPGVYDLKANVTNPCVDRRQRHDWTKAARVMAGARFVVRDAAHHYGGEKCRLLMMVGEYEHQCLVFNGPIDQPLLHALVSHLVPAEGRDADYDLRWGSGCGKFGGHTAARLLRQAYVEERIGDAWLKQALEAIYGEDEASDEGGSND